ncbi:MAG TPA: stage IV sporulation protein A [Candidatus Enterenecus merdae]|nr:stage IV sporulation protein A [Candidatus Enterenecus merdae]
MENHKLYEEIAQRTQGDIYLGVVGPVRTGKSTFIKRFMETLVLPKIENTYVRDRARDELPQSGSGRVVMTAEPKFVPEDAVVMAMEDGSTFSVRLIDCVGYLVPSAMGQFDGDLPRMVTTPWFDHEIPMTQAAEFGTRKVIADHSTIGIVITTDGTVTDIPREDYLEAEERVITELKELGKPFVVLLNSAQPEGDRAQTIQADLAERYDVTCMAVNCLALDEGGVSEIIRGVLHEFPIKQMELFLPAWVDVLPFDHPIKSSLYAMIREETAGLQRIRDAEQAVAAMGCREEVSRALLNRMDMGSGVVTATLELPRSLFYTTVSERCGLNIADDGDLIDQLTQLAAMKKNYEKVEGALAQVERTGYGIVMPDIQEMILEEPEIVKQGGRYGVRLRASAPSIHMMRADIKTELSPIMGTEKQSEEMVDYLLRQFEGDTGRIWDSNIFGRSFHELVGEDLQSKLKRMPEDAREKLRETLERIINEGSGGLICIIL